MTVYRYIAHIDKIDKLPKTKYLILADLAEGEPVRIQQQGKWKPAVVVSKAETPRSYNVMTRSGAEYRRNRRHLRKSKEDQALFTPDSSVGLDGQSDEVLPRERTSPNDHSRDEVVNQDQNSARGDAG